MTDSIMYDVYLCVACVVGVSAEHRHRIGRGTEEAQVAPTVQTTHTLLLHQTHQLHAWTGEGGVRRGRRWGVSFVTGGAKPSTTSSPL
jgi:hypothetical protein